MRFIPSFRPLLPGLALCLAVTGAAFAAQRAEEALFGRAWLEPWCWLS
jgi:hypothetical protein